jgi:hypothetical protein
MIFTKKLILVFCTTSFFTCYGGDGISFVLKDSKFKEFIFATTNLGCLGISNGLYPSSPKLTVDLEKMQGEYIKLCTPQFCNPQYTPYQLFQLYYKNSSLKNKVLIGVGCLLVSISLVSSAVNLCGAIKKRFIKK